jgi:hypothetical protein
MTKSNDIIYEADFENDKVRKSGYFSDIHDLCADDPIEERLSEVKKLSKVPIRSRDDIYHALKDKETLDKVLEQGLDEEHQKYKEQIAEFCMSLKDCILKGGDNAYASYTNDHQRQQRKCSNCQEFSNIHCVNCDVWLCVDHWKEHITNNHRITRIIAGS